MTEKTMTEDGRKVLEHVEAINSGQYVRQEPVVHSKVEPFRQGDVYVWPVPEDFARGKMLGTKQVAVGDTVGSRHIAEGPGITVYQGTQLPPQVDPRKFPEGVDASEAIGRLVEAPEGWTLTHPEHADHVCPAGVYMTSNQIDLQTLRRVAD